MLLKVLRAALLLAVLVYGNVEATESAAVRLQKRLQATSPDAGNAYLDTEAGWKRDGLPFFAQVKQCNLAALKLMLALMKSTNASTTKGNNDLMELAMGRCPEILLPLVPLDSIPGLCAVDAWAESKAKLVWCADLFCTYRVAAARAAFARVTLARMSLALAVQMKGLGCAL